ncbi:MAG: hypothetical protein IPM49_01925 [Flavobacteriales bacterium]|nr:hypothetical protein [Flavobacteriales bacterium]
MNDQLDLIAYSAPDRPDLNDEFIRQHELVLTEVGIPLVIKSDTRWTRDPQCYVIVAVHPTLGMVGGIRLQMDHGEEGRLPMMAAIAGREPRIVTVLERLRAEGNGEVCGLWSASRYANKGVTVLLSKAVTAIAPQVGARRMVCFVGNHTRRHPERNGFIAMAEVGELGEFDYPTPEFRSIAMLNPDTILLPCTTMDQRQSIFSLRLRPDQVRVENPGRTTIQVHYQLILTKGLFDLVAYERILEERLRHSA